MRKSHFNDEFLVLLGTIISRLFTCSNVEKNNNKTKGACSSPISMSINTERANMHCRGIACTRSFNMGLSSAEGKKLDCFV